MGAVLCLGFADLALLMLVLGPALQIEAEQARSQPVTAERQAARPQRSAPSARGAAPASRRDRSLVAPTATAPVPTAQPAALPTLASAAAPEPTPEPRPSAPAPEPPPVLFFGTGGATVTSPMRIALQGVAAAMRAAGELRLLCRGHADARGTAEANLALSRRRAESVAAVLVHMGVARERLAVEALGASEPLDAGSNPAAWDRNRRVEFRWR
ncbi:MAG: OmpA family protein [Proteobacteria bacterium]|nr:OmpA family protein [Pseudomonadota bacterium]